MEMSERAMKIENCSFAGLPPNTYQSILRIPIGVTIRLGEIDEEVLWEGLLSGEKEHLVI